ncbi:MAG: NADH:flavin oxidoreductase [Acidimicrobiia bacterium]|nr:NADH:flavin oxidoreductase [Acidimicrobiia bacterium]MYG72298.1 NADH:flavin oxidoreductase [Acidimicrobiia bacterium]
MARIRQVKSLASAAALRNHLEDLGVEIPMDDEVDPAGALAQPLAITDGSAGTMTARNRWAVLPMEGWDGEDDGRPSDLVRRRWDRFAASGAGLLWGEATAVRPDGRANPRQLVLDETTVEEFAVLRARLDPSQLTGLQLTHSGRYARPTTEGPAPKTVYEHPLLDARVESGAAEVLTDEELDELVEQFIDRAVLAHQAGFEFVDIKACHGYLGHEFLSAFHRPGPFGGDLEGRTRFLRSIITGIRRQVPDLGVAVRLSLFDFVPHTIGEGGVGVPEAFGPYQLAFGGDGSGVGTDLTETHRVLDMLDSLGVGLVCASAGSPYYVPHIQRPAYFPPSDGYQPPEDPLVGVARLIAATAEIARRHPKMTVVAAGLSYLQEWLPNVGQALVDQGMADAVGLGRMILSYPHMPADVMASRELDRRLICRTFSDCTTAPRSGLISGCYPLDDFYNEREERIQLAAFKKAAKARLR